MASIYSKRRSTQYLWSTLVTATVIGCAAFVYIGFLFGNDYSGASLRNFSKKPEKLTEENCVSVCDSVECVYHAKSLLSRVDPAADACENFYELTCGGFLSQFQKNESHRFSSHFLEKMEMVLGNLVESIAADHRSVSGKVKTIYETCMKKNSLDFEAIPTLLLFLDSVGIPNWPNIDPDFKFVEPNLEGVLSNLLKYNEYGFVDIDAKYAFREEFYTQVNASVSAAKGAYANKGQSMRKQLLEKVLLYFDLDFQTINEIWRESEVIKDVLTQLKQESERIDKENEDSAEKRVDCENDNEKKWKPLCRTLESLVEVADVNAGISKRFADISGNSVYFLENIFEILSNFSDRSIANYLGVNLIFNHFSELNFYFLLTLQKDPEFTGKVFGDKLPADQKQRCIKWLAENMFVPLGHEYMKEILTESVMKELINLVEEFIEETADAISKQDWMTQDVRLELKQTVGNITHGLEMYEYALGNETFLTELYDQFHPTDSTFMRNVFEYQRFSKVQDMLGVLMAEDLIWIRPDILKPNAGGGGSSVDLFFGLLMPPVFLPGIKRLINLVSLGSVTIHEIGHVLNQNTARLENLDKGLKDYMEELSVCLNHQYSQFKFDHLGKNMNGSQYLHENYADVVAISVIDKIIAKYSSADDEFLLPGFPYTMQQMLYISSLQVWCESSSKEDEEMNDKRDPHTLAKFRLIGMIQNSKGFSKAFNCPEGSYMNPVTKCLFPI